MRPTVYSRLRTIDFEKIFMAILFTLKSLPEICWEEEDSFFFIYIIMFQMSKPWIESWSYIDFKDRVYKYHYLVIYELILGCHMIIQSWRIAPRYKIESCRTQMCYIFKCLRYLKRLQTRPVDRECNRLLVNTLWEIALVDGDYSHSKRISYSALRF